ARPATTNRRPLRGRAGLGAGPAKRAAPAVDGPAASPAAPRRARARASPTRECGASRSQAYPRLCDDERIALASRRRCGRLRLCDPMVNQRERRDRMSTIHAPIDEASVGAFMQRTMGDAAGLMTAVLAMLGDRLGLFTALAEGGPADSEELAARANVSERY